MKRTGLTWAFFALQIIFMLVIPCAFIWAQYGDLATRYKVSTTAILLLVVVFLTFKRVFLSKYLKTIDGKILNIETNALTITDESAIKANKKAWRFYSMIQLLTSAIVPILLFVFAIQTIEVVEAGLIKLYGCLMCCLLSVVVGVVFRIAEIYSMRLTHEKKES